jgi:hypothetical protein
MAKRSVSHRSVTLTAVADTTNFTDSGYPFALQGASSTQVTNVSEVFLGGQSTSSATTFTVFGRDSTIGVTLTADATLNDAALSAATAALAAAVVTFNKASGTEPKRSSTLGCLLNCTFNAFGGIYRWVAPDVNSYISMIGNTASLGELSLTAFTGGSGIVGAHCIYETL